MGFAPLRIKITIAIILITVAMRFKVDIRISDEMCLDSKAVVV